MGKQDIMKNDMEHARITTNFCYTIAETYLGYLTGKDISYYSNDRDVEDIQDILNYNDVSQNDTTYLKYALVNGYGAELAWLDEEGKQRFTALDPRTVIPVYKDDLTKELAFVIRYFPVCNIDEYNKEYRVEVYYEDRTNIYIANNSLSTLILMDQKPNYFNQIPITIWSLNEEQEAIFAKVMGLQDAYNELMSGEVDSFRSFCDAYMVITGAVLDADDAEDIKEHNTITLPEGGKIDFLTKNINDTQIDNMLDNIVNNIHKISCCPDFTDEKFGTSSGIALKYRLLGFENIASTIEKNMTKALQKRIELICSIMSLTGGEEVWRDISIKWTRNLPDDIQDIANGLNLLRGLVSNKTLLAQVPFVKNVDAESQQVEEQQGAIYEFAEVLDSETGRDTNQ